MTLGSIPGEANSSRFDTIRLSGRASPPPSSPNAGSGIGGSGFEGDLVAHRPKSLGDRISTALSTLANSIRWIINQITALWNGLYKSDESRGGTGSDVSSSATSSGSSSRRNTTFNDNLIDPPDNDSVSSPQFSRCDSTLDASLNPPDSEPPINNPQDNDSVSSQSSRSGGNPDPFPSPSADGATPPMDIKRQRSWSREDSSRSLVSRHSLSAGSLPVLPDLLLFPIPVLPPTSSSGSSAGIARSPASPVSASQRTNFADLSSPEVNGIFSIGDLQQAEAELRTPLVLDPPMSPPQNPPPGSSTIGTDGWQNRNLDSMFMSVFGSELPVSGPSHSPMQQRETILEVDETENSTLTLLNDLLDELNGSSSANTEPSRPISTYSRPVSGGSLEGVTIDQVELAIKACIDVNAEARKKSLLIQYRRIVAELRDLSNKQGDMQAYLEFMCTVEVFLQNCRPPAPVDGYNRLVQTARDLFGNLCVGQFPAEIQRHQCKLMQEAIGFIKRVLPRATGENYFRIAALVAQMNTSDPQNFSHLRQQLQLILERCHRQHRPPQDVQASLILTQKREQPERADVLFEVNTALANLAEASNIQVTRECFIIIEGLNDWVFSV